MRIWTLIENTACGPDFAFEHGLSLYIETDGTRILFDAGQSGAFVDNARLLGVDLRRVDYAVLSHGHYDHGGGLAEFLRINDHAPIYLSCHAFDGHYNAAGKNIGLNPELANSPRLVYVKDSHALAPGVMIYNPDNLPPARTDGLKRLEKGALADEDFRHEQYLLIREGERLFCFSGCAHRGVVGIAQYFRPDVLVGGFHFKSLPADSPALIQAAQALMALPTTYYTGHCTGEEQFATLKKYMGKRLQALHSGTVLEL